MFSPWDSGYSLFSSQLIVEEYVPLLFKDSFDKFKLNLTSTLKKAF